MYLTRKEHFSASHRLFNPGFSDEKNLETYGKCAYPNGHGHNYEIEVTVVGEAEKETGMIVDLKKLSDIETELESRRKELEQLLERETKARQDLEKLIEGLLVE